MDAKTCLEKLKLVGVLSFATVDGEGNPQRCIIQGEPYQIQQEHCLHCGSCYENCPANAVWKRGWK